VKDQVEETVQHLLRTLSSRITELEAELAASRDTVDRQRRAFQQWSSMTNAITEFADIQTCPRAGHLRARMNERVDAMSPDERAAWAEAMKYVRHSFAEPVEAEE